MVLNIKACIETFPIAGSFVISRETRTRQVVVVVEITDGTHTGRGECVPYKRYDETPEGVIGAIHAMAPALGGGLTREDLQTAMPHGAARNAIDCALWDLAAKQQARPVWQLAGLAEPKPLVTAYTLSLGTPQGMMEAAKAAASRPLLKVKLGGDGDPERIRAVRAGAPHSRLVVDANEAWTPALYASCIEACIETGVEMIEQPLPADDDSYLDTAPRPVCVCADESLHDRSDLVRLRARYDAINIKLDKAGGLTEALKLAQEAKALDYRIMVGCMLATSLAMAPAILVAQGADVVDLDGPLLLAADRTPSLRYDGSILHPPLTNLWG